jgi:hypothetical protein
VNIAGHISAGPRVATPNHAVEPTASSFGFATLRLRFLGRLTASVAMTSNVKSWQQIFLGVHDVLSSVHRTCRSQSDPTVDPAAIRGLVTT